MSRKVPRKSDVAEPSLRDKLGADFTKAIEEQWREHGKEVLEAMREKDPVRFAELVARLVPGEPVPASPYASAKSVRDVGRIMLTQAGLEEWRLTDELADEAIAINTRFNLELETLVAQIQADEH